MNKFKKILVLMLVLAVSLTVFAVVAFASDEEETLEKKRASIGSYLTYETYEEGELAEANPDGAGHFEIAVAENGNKYIKHHVSKGTGNTSYAGNGYQANNKYSISEYPYLTLDFDIAKIEGDYAGAGFNPYYYGNGDVYDDYGNLYKTLKQVTGGNTSVYLSTFKKYLPTEFNTWAHVTILFKYHIMDDTEYIGGYIYVNGELVHFDHTLHTLNTEYPAANYYFGTFRINNHGGTNTTNFSGYDNWQINVFNRAYTEEEIIAEVYPDGYELPYGVTIAKIGNAVYDRIPKAVDAFKNGDVITLIADINTPINVDKPVTFDLNKYDEDGNPTGEFYNLSTTSTTLVSDFNEETGLLVFKQVQNASVQVYWDDCPGVAAGGECTCPDVYLNENGEHTMSEFTPSAMLNSIPSYTGEIPTFPIVDGVSKQFVGWSYTQGGEVEDLRVITADDVNEGWIALYPVYEVLQYSFELIDASGNSTYFLEDEYDAVFASASKNSTIKLHSDVATKNAISFNQTLTLDLNGYSFGNLLTKTTPYEAIYDPETGKYTKGAALGEQVTTGDGGYVFYITKSSFTFNITSSRPGAVMYNVNVTADQLIHDGKVVGSEVTGLTGSGLFSLYPSSATFNIYGENITFYTGTLFYAEHGGCSSSLSVNIDGGTYNIVASFNNKGALNLGEGLFALRRGGNHTVKNATFNCNGLLIWKNAWAKETTMTFDNCNIYNASVYNTSAVDKMYINNSRVHLLWSGGNKTPIIIGENNKITFEYDNPDRTYELAEGIEANAITETFTYDVFPHVANKNSAVGVLFDPITLEPLLENDAVKTEGTFIYQTFNPMYGPTNVTFKDLNGNVISQFVANKNRPVTAPVVALGDGWRAVSNVIWRDADGNVSDLMLGDADEYVFTAELPEEAAIEYDSHLSVAMMSMSYYSSFAYNLYVPKVDGVEVTAICGAAPDRVVSIGENEYYLYTVSVEAVNSFDDFIASVEYVIDGQTFASSITMSAYVYAMASVSNASHTAADKEVTGALVRYIEECYKYAAAGASVARDVQEKLDAFYAQYTPADYVTEYPAEELHTVNVDAVGGLIESICFNISDGARVGISVTLTDEAVELGYRVSLGDSVLISASEDGKTFSAYNAPLHSVLMNPTYTISVTDAEGNVVSRDLDGDETAETLAQTSYSMATYLKAMQETGADVELVKAFYAFGKAVIAVREGHNN